LLKTSSFALIRVIRGPVSFTAETAVPPSFSPRLGGSAGEFGDYGDDGAPGAVLVLNLYLQGSELILMFLGDA